MKKRLLSALLALVMVLTLLPVSAFAATDPANRGETVRYFSSEVTTGEDWQKHGIGWYKGSGQKASPYTLVGSGVAVGSTAGQGAWYPNISDALVASGSVISLISDDSGNVWIGRNVTIDLYGKTISGSINVAGRVDNNGDKEADVANRTTSLTLQDSLYTGGTMKSVGGNITIGEGNTDWGLNRLALRLNNVALGGQIDFWSSGSSSITLDNATVGGHVKIIGVGTSTSTLSTGNSISLTGTRTAVTGAVSVEQSSGSGSATKGVVTVTQGAKANGGVSVAQDSGNYVVLVSEKGVVGIDGITVTQKTGGSNVVTVSGGSTVGSKGITVTQDSGAPTVTVTGANSSGGPIKVTQKYGGSVSVTNSAAAGTIIFKSTKGVGTNRSTTNPSVTVDTGARVKAIEAQGDSLEVNVGSGADVTQTVKVFGRWYSELVTGETESTLIAPTITVNGGRVGGGIAQLNTSADAIDQAYTVEIKGGGTVSGGINLHKASITVNTASVKGDTVLNSGTMTVGPNATVEDVKLGSAADSNPKMFGTSATLNVKEFGNTIGAVTQVASNNKTLVLTIPGTNHETQNPRDNDRNKIKSVVVGDITKWNLNSSYIKGGHFTTGLTGNSLKLLDKDITYIVEEVTAADAWYEDYLTSYWGNSLNLINTLANMTGTIKPDNGVPTIKSKDADGADEITVSLYAYSPRVNPNGPAGGTPVGTETKTATPLLNIVLKKPAGGSANTFILPSLLGTNTSINWSTCTVDSQNKVSNVSVDKTPGGQSIVPTADVSYISNSLSYRVTKVLDVQTAETGNYNATVKATFNSATNTVTLSGLAQVYGTGNAVIIPLVIETDAIEEVYVNAVWNPTDGGSGSLFFADPLTPHEKLSVQTGNDLILDPTDHSRLLLVANNTRVSLKASGLTQETLVGVEYQGNTGTGNSLGGMVTTTNRLPETQAFGKTLKDQLAKAMTKPAGKNGPVDFSASPTVQQEFGAYIATKLNQTTLNNLLKQTQQSKYLEQHPTFDKTKVNTLTKELLESTGYTRIAVVLYMQVDVTSFASTAPYNMTATMTPYARVEIQHKDWDDTVADADADKQPVIVIPGTSIGTLDSGNVGSITVTLPDVTGVFPAMVAPTGFAHQNNTYGAAVTDGEFTLTHTAANGDGFGTIVINRDVPTAEIKTYDTDATTYVAADPRKLYDSVQAAVDDVKNGELIDVLDTGSTVSEYPINVTGRARTFYMNVTGNKKITRATGSSGYTLGEPNANSKYYTVQLAQDVTPVTPPAPVEDEVTISVAAVTNGSALVSLNKAKAGDSITVTARPNAGYGVSSLTIRTNTGATVTYQSTATNVYKFTVPQNVTSITVTPAFAVSSVATISIADVANGLATHNATDGKAKGGSTVTVTTRPFNGYAATGVTAVTDTGAAVAVTRIAENTYTFVVPVTATRVVVTPVFGAANRHPFIDVPDGQWFTDAVSFCYRNNMMKGYGSDYMFSGTSKLTRGELVQILYRLSGEPYNTGDSGFNDVQSTAWYAKAVTWASRNNIVTGGDGNKFYPTNVITRQDLAQILYKYNTYRGGNRGLIGNLSGYFDQSSVSGYAQTAMQWAVGNGIVTGSNNMLMPKGDASRYEAAVMLMRYGQNFMGLT